MKLGGPNDGADRVGGGKIDDDSDDDMPQAQVGQPHTHPPPRLPLFGE